MTRRLLRWLACGLIGSLLSMQLALAAHACAVGLPSSIDPTSGSVIAFPSDDADVDLPATPDMSDCEWLIGVVAPDDASMNLCNEHCKQGQQSDHAGTLVVPAAFLTARYVVAPPLDVAPLRHPAVETESALAAGRPPHAILHCVLRT